MTTASPFTKPGKAGTPRLQIKDTAEDRAPVERDQYGRYLLPDPMVQTGKPEYDGPVLPWTRVSTLAHELSTMIGIERWERKHQARGIALRPDLAQLAAALPIESREAALAAGRESSHKQWEDLFRKAMDFSGADSRANLGTGMHELTYRHNSGEQGIRNLVLPAHQPDFDLYLDLLDQMRAQLGFRINPHLLERIVVNTGYGCAGTFDNGLSIPGQNGPLWAVGDLKTGQDLKYGWLEILIQLYLYATADAMWDPEAQQFVAMPPFSTDFAYVFHLPMDGTAELIKLDLTDVGTWVDAAITSRDAKKQAPNRVTTVLEIESPAVTTSWDDAHTVVQPPAGAPEQQGAYVQSQAYMTPAQVGAAITEAWTPKPGVIACGPEAPTAEDLSAVNEMSEYLSRNSPSSLPLDQFTMGQRYDGPITPAVIEENPYGLDPHAYPTKQAFQDACKAAERRAAAGLDRADFPTFQAYAEAADQDAYQAASGFTVPDYVAQLDEREEQANQSMERALAAPRPAASETVQIQRVKVVGEQPDQKLSPVKLNAGKKACSVCRMPGHRKGSPKCSGKPPTDDPAAGLQALAVCAQCGRPQNGHDPEENHPFFVTQAAADAWSGPDGKYRDLVITQNPARVVPPVTGVCPRTTGHAGLAENGAGWTLNQDAGLWVCSVCGQPAEKLTDAEWEQNKDAMQRTALNLSQGLPADHLDNRGMLSPEPADLVGGQTDSYTPVPADEQGMQVVAGPPVSPEPDPWAEQPDEDRFQAQRVILTQIQTALSMAQLDNIVRYERFRNDTVWSNDLQHAALQRREWLLKAER